MAKRSTKVAVAYGTVNPVLYGADGVIDSTVSDNLVNFIFGKTNDGKGQDLKTKLSLLAFFGTIIAAVVSNWHNIVK